MVQGSYKNNFSQERHRFIPKPYELIYQCFIDAGFDKKPKEFFKENASEVVKTLRSSAWDRYTEGERNFENYAHDRVSTVDDYFY